MDELEGGVDRLDVVDGLVEVGGGGVEEEVQAIEGVDEEVHSVDIHKEEAVDVDKAMDMDRVVFFFFLFVVAADNDGANVVVVVVFFFFFFVVINVVVAGLVHAQVFFLSRLNALAFGGGERKKICCTTGTPALGHLHRHPHC